MAKHILTARRVATEKRPGLYGDGDNLYLKVTPTGNKSWIFRYTVDGKTKKMGLGTIRDISLARAREICSEYRVLIFEGIDPKAHREKIRAENKAEPEIVPTFSATAEDYIAAQEAGWKNPKHRQQWRNTLSTYANPVIGDMPVADITIDDVLKVLTPIWYDKTETASRVRGRIEKVIAWAIVKKQRDQRLGNPAMWRGALELLLPSPASLKTVKHHAALPYKQIPDFMQKLGTKDTSASICLEFLILSAARSSEVRMARKKEFDLDRMVWEVPGDRMKKSILHTVPITPRMKEIIELFSLVDGPYLFPGQKNASSLSENAFEVVLEDLGYGDYTAHGFRSSFRDWGAEHEKKYDDQALEFCLAHKIRDKAKAAYLRTNLLDERRVIMHDWHDYCYSKN